MTVAQQIQRAVFRARTRTGDRCVGVRMRRGHVQLVRVEKHFKGRRSVTQLSDYMPAPAIVEALDAYRAGTRVPPPYAMLLT